MFLPRASASSSSSSNDINNNSKFDDRSAQSFRASPFQHSPRRYGLIRTGGAGQVAGWSQSTTAPASVQVHYHYLAGRYRDLSNERGLGLSSSGIASSSSTATLGGILEAERDEVNSIEGDARSVNNFQASPNGKTLSASNSLRAIARKTGGAGKGTSSQSTRLQDLFGRGAALQDKPHNSISPTKNTTKRNGETLEEVARTSHKGKQHNSLRSYAEERLKAQEAIESRIERATDTGRLKWEARAAMLNSSFGLAILLYTRAAQLGSISAALSLAHLYASGLTRGSKPMVVLVHRDPLRSISWALEAARLLQHRTNKRAKVRGASANWSKAESDQPAQIVALLARLLRCRQAGLTAASDTKLPTVRRRRSGRNAERSDSIWEAVCESMEWLDQQLVAHDPPTHDDGHSIGPDDDEHDVEAIKAFQSRTHVSLIEALVATRRWAIASNDQDDKAFVQLTACWNKFYDALRKEGSSPRDSSQGGLSSINYAVETLPRDKTRLKAFTAALDESLPESEVPVASGESNITQLESPSKRRAGQLARRKASLEELPPLDALAKKVHEQATRPALLRHHSSSEVKPTPAVVFGVNAPATQKDGLGRVFSLPDGSRRPTLSSSATVSHLESLTMRPRHKERGALQSFRRPSSVMSASPSLLFPTRDEDSERQREGTSANKEEDTGLHSSSSVVSSLWKAAPLHARQSSQGKAKTRDRVASLYGIASVAPSERVDTAGSTTYDYDIDAALQRQQTRRRRGDSNASISTLASALSTNPSISASVTGSEYAQGQFLSPSPSSNINGFDFRAGGAADSLRRIRKASISRAIAKDIPTAPHLSDTLEDLIANSASYRAVNAKNSAAPLPRTRRDSNASLRSLTAFTGNNQRQTSYGDMRSPSLSQGGRAGSISERGPALRSPTLSLSTSYFNITPQTVNGTLQARSRVPSHGAVGSLRLLGRQASSQSVSKAASSPLTKAKQDVVAMTSPKEEASSPSPAAVYLEPTKAPNATHRSFEANDPTHHTVTKTQSRLTSPASSIHNQHHHHHHDSNNITSKRNDSIGSNDHRINHNHNHNRHHQHNHRNSITTLDPALAEAEERSGLKTTSTCTICQAKVVNAPVSKSGQTFCSRECRIEMKKRRTAEAKAKEA